jgi:hypothetical protein
MTRPTPAYKVGDTVTTRNNRQARIVAIDRKDPEYPIIALVTNPEGYETVQVYTSSGVSNMSTANYRSLDLQPPKGSYDDWRINDPIWVWNDLSRGPPFPAHFAGIAEDGRPRVWPFGATSHSSNGKPPIAWNYASKDRPR